MVSRLYWILILAISATYLLSAATAIQMYDKYLSFFQNCGYSESFAKFIIGVELFGAFGVLFRITRCPALLILAADMAGATFTDFHNYFSKGTSGPLGNSLPSLAMLTFLVSLTWMTLSFPQELLSPGRTNKSTR